MKVLITGKSGSGKTYLLNRIRSNFVRRQNMVLDLDYIGYRDSSNKWRIPESVVRALLQVHDIENLICVGISSNISSYAYMFDVVILLSGEITDDHRRSIIDRETIRRARLGYVPNHTIDDVLSDLENPLSILELLPEYTLVMTQDLAYEHVAKLCVSARIGQN